MDIARERSERITSPTEESRVARSATTHTLQSGEQLDAFSERLHRAHGQWSAVVLTFDDGSTGEEMVTQLAVLSRAVNAAAFNLISASLTDFLADRQVASAPLVETFQKLFLSMA